MYSLNLSNFILHHFVNMGYRCNSTWVHKFCPSFYTVNTVKLMNKLYEIPIHLLHFVYSNLVVLLCLEIMNGIACTAWCYCKTRVTVKYSRIIIVFGGPVFMAFVGYSCSQKPRTLVPTKCIYQRLLNIYLCNRTCNQ